MRWTNSRWLSEIANRAAAMVLPRHRPLHYGGREFSPPHLLSEALLPEAPGIYAIHVRRWWFGMTPIHFGSSHNLKEELLVNGHEGFVGWLSHRGAKRGLFVSFHQDHALDHEARHRESLRLYRHRFPQREHSVDEHLELQGFNRPRRVRLRHHEA